MCFSSFPKAEFHLWLKSEITSLSDLDKRHAFVLFCDSQVNSEIQNIIFHLAQSQSPFKHFTGCLLWVIGEYTNITNTAQVPPGSDISNVIIEIFFMVYFYFWPLIFLHFSLLLYEITLYQLLNTDPTLYTKTANTPDTQSIVLVISMCSIAGLAGTKQYSL